jgi:hypothetical protein
MRMFISSFVISVSLLASTAIAKITTLDKPGSIDLTRITAGNEVLLLKNTSSKPAPDGLLHTLTLALPAYNTALTFGSDGKRATGIIPSNRAHLWLRDASNKLLNSPEIKAGAGNFSSPPTSEGVFTVFRLTDGRYLAALPLIGETSIAYFDFKSGSAPVLKVSSFGTALVVGDLPLVSVAASADLYDACQRVWTAALTSRLPGITAKLRDQKDYPEYFRYLGWCTWEEYRSKISENLITRSVEKIRASRIPIRWILLDEGTQWHTSDNEKNRMKVGRLKSFAPRPDHFPNGLAPITSLKNDTDIRWMGIWHHQGGFFGGLDKSAIANDPAAGHFAKQPRGQFKAKPDYDSQIIFFDRLFASSRKAGFDFVKVDFQGPTFQAYLGGDNAVTAHVNTNRALEDHCRTHSLGLIHCFAQDIICALSASHAPVIRVSQDYRSGKLTPARIQTYQCYNNKLWLGHVFWGDHDMFHSEDPVANRLMAVSKAMSGAPVYLSDPPENFVRSVITPLCYADGEIIRPIAPALPLPESLFNDPINQKDLYRVIAPLPNGAASIVCYNLHDRDDKATVTGRIFAEDYRHASALIQPYPGPWKQPACGLIAYNHFEGTIHDLENPLPVSLTGFSDHLVHLLPVQHGWAYIGLTEKFLAPATVLDPSFTDTTASFRVREPGPFALYSKSGTPAADGLAFESRGDGLWLTRIPPNLTNRKIVVSRN